MNNWSQETRSMGIETQLGKDALLLLSVAGEEAISELFSLKVELASQRMDIAAKEVIGKPVDIWIRQDDVSKSKRFYNGYINRFSLGPLKASGYRTYRAEIVPWLWFHDQNRDCRIFQNKTVVEVIEELLSGISIAKYQVNCTKQYPKLDYCVQYRESNMSFLTRLAEHHGLFFFFTHKKTEHTLIIADQATAYFDCKQHSVIQTNGSYNDAHITTWDHQYEAVTNEWSQTDFNYETPTTDLNTTSQTVLDTAAAEQIKRYDYPGGYGIRADGQLLTDIHMMEDEERFDTVQAESNYRSFQSSGRFIINQHDFAHEKGKEYVITRLNFDAKEPSYFTTNNADKFSFSNSFSAIPANLAYYRTLNKPNPMIHGPQTAVVTGPSGEKIYTDKYGRVKINFHWDRHGANDETSSCWVRVSQNWAGKKWGEMSIPHVGNEVIVSFLEGDPDKPIITGRVYNGDNMPPENLPTNREKRIISDDGGNEIIMNGAQGQQQIRIESPGSAALVLGHNATNLIGPKGNKGDKGDVGASGTPGADAPEEDEGEIVKGNFRAIHGNIGDKFEFGLGNNYGASLGDDFEFRGGSKIELYVGSDLEFKAAMSTALHLGTQFEYSFGTKCEAHKGPIIEFSDGAQTNESKLDILSHAKKDHVIAAGDSLCLVANCEDIKGVDKKTRSIIGAKGDEISLSIGKDYKAPTIASHKEWYKKTSELTSMEETTALQLAMLGAASITALSTTLPIAILSFAGSFLSSKEPVGATFKFIFLGIEIILAIARAVITTVLVVITCSEAKRLTKDELIEPIDRTGKECDAKIDISKEKGIEIISKEKAVNLVSGKLKDKNSTFLKLAEEIAQLSINKSKIWMAKNSGTITLDTLRTAGSSGKIELLAKGNIDLESDAGINIKSASEVKIKSTSFNASGNLKVLK